MKIAIDLDDVLSDTITSLVAYFNENHNPEIKPEMLADFSYWGFLGQTREEANEKFFKFTDSVNFDEIRPNEGAIEFIEELSKDNELYIVTGRPLFLKEKTEAWVERYFPGRFKGICFTNKRLDKNDFSPYWGRAKAEICAEIGATVLIDDLFDYIRESEKLRVYLIDRPWNQGEVDSHVVRVSRFTDILKTIRTSYAK